MSISLQRRNVIKTLGASLIVCSCSRAAAHSQHQHNDEQMSDDAESILQPDTGNTVAGHSQIQARYSMPPVYLLDQNGSSVDLARQLNTPGPVLLNFIFTSCPGICPILSAVLAQASQLLGEDRQRVRMWSLSIDPDNDRPEQLRQYANAFNAHEQWRFLTGSAAAVMQIRQAFGAESDNKMAHLPLFLIRQQHDEWLRMEGDVTPMMLATEVQGVLLASQQ
ncbi:SCO family protein [Granulosicoccus antarcticus]|uniref:Thioredoxin domain-containing protein n=1 Tax=Granulosicoccus antarcticus IMCC3135 TaxID=1192854 RepID=A0A2Z2NNU5_9GAMM|nr:SCO family protein [Granulosicoccus antarcticus]ASJ72903.1 hypothetical protein IMCC3135_14090 [Granulosicoccus antarcticus IMCC3135]